MKALFQNWNTTDSVWETTATVVVENDKVVDVLGKDGVSVPDVDAWLNAQRGIPSSEGRVTLAESPEKWLKLSQLQRYTYHRVITE